MNHTNQKLVVRCTSISIDGYAAGPNQRVDQPFGDHTEGLHDWLFATRSARQAFGMDGGDENLDDHYVAHADTNIGATIIGRNMFGPSRGAWPDDGWTGPWGPNPPYHHPVFILTHYPKPSIPMQGGTNFHFATSGIEATLEQAFDAADGRDVRLVGGPTTIQQYLRAGLVDEMHIVVVPMLVGAGERLLDNLEHPIGYHCTEHISTPAVTHLRFERRH